MREVLKQLFTSNQYIPHGHCYLWQSQLVWLHIMSDLLIAIAYFSIPMMLIYFIYKRNDVPFLGIFGLFGAFIVFCGTGHLLEIWTLWYPVYWVTGIQKAMTALISCYTALEMVTRLPQFLALQTPERLAAINRELQDQIVERQQAQQALQGTVAEIAKAKSALHCAYEELENRVNEATEGLRRRTAELGKANAALEAEIQERIAAESALRTSETRLRKQQTGLLELAKSQSIYEGNFSEALREITQMASCTLNIERVSVWFYTEKRTKLNCVNLYEFTSNRHSQGLKIAVTDYPNYFKALENDRVIAVYDAHTDPRTTEFSASYLTPFSVTSLLDFPIYFKGQTVGVICLEHTLTKRCWAIEEQNFGSYLAYMTYLAMESRDRKQAEIALWQMAERERAMSRVIQQMRQTLQVETIFSATTQELRQVLNCDRVVIYRFNPDWSGEIVSESVALGWIKLMQTQTNEPAQSEAAVDRASCVVKTLGSVNQSVQDTDTYLQDTQGGVYSQGTNYLCVSDIYKAGFQPCYIERLERFQAKAYIIVPIFCGKKLWGLLAAYQNLGPRQWEEAEISMVVQIGTQLGVAVQHAELLARTQQQTQELKKAKEAADTANQAKSEFLANMSHELRTPLNAILGFTQVMQRDSSLSTEQQQYVNIVSRSGKHLLELINDVLEMSKIEAGRVTLHENSFNLYSLLDSLEEMLQVEATSKGLAFTFERTNEIPQYVKTDASKLRQVLQRFLIEQGTIEQ